MNRGKRKGFVTIALVIASIVAALVVEVIGGSSGGASTPNASTTVTTSSSRGASPPGTGGASSGTVASANFKTVGTSVNLRAGASTSSTVITVLTDLGTPLTLTCYVRGTSIGSDPWWYRASFINAHGYVAGYWVNTGPDPAKTRLAPC